MGGGSLGKRGPRPQPTVLKIERGNPGKRALNAEEPTLQPADALAAPKGLTGRAKEEWDRLVGELTAKGVLTIGDTTAFEEYCYVVGEVDAYKKLVKKVGRESAQQLGYANALLKLRAQMKQWAAEIGLTPSSRSGVKAVRTSSATDAEKKHRRFFGAGNAS